jgi:LytS/YehU family sensor histidine kinase
MYQYHTPFGYALLATAIWFVGQAGLIYTCMYGLMPRFFVSRRYGLFALSLLAVLLLSSAFIAVVAGTLFRHITPGFSLSLYTFFFYILLNNAFIAGFVIAARIIRDRVKAERHNQQVEKERAETELRFLKSQVNPHFLFNAINSIYVLIKKDPVIAASSLAQFADMLRYQLYECNVDAIPIEKELAYLENYIGLEKLRKGAALTTVFSVGEEVRHFSIAPLLIIPFVENAFKHVFAPAGGETRIYMAMKYAEPFFELQVENTTGAGDTSPVEKNYKGIGLENVQRRLALIYPQRHLLRINTENGVYSVTLQIKITG